MKISVVIATFNGERFLEEQLRSLLNQRRVPDEIVISDDCSEDNTVNLVREISCSTEIPIRIHVNDRRKGFRSNFEEGLKMSSGDIVLLCDQDDVWDPHKVESMEYSVMRHPAHHIHQNDAVITDTDLVPVGSRILDHSRDSCLGCSLTMTREFLELALPFPSFSSPDVLLGHDSWLNALGVSLGTKRVLRSCLQVWRRHGDNSSVIPGERTDRPGVRRGSILEAARRPITNQLTARLELLQEVNRRVSANHIQAQSLAGIPLSVARLSVDREVTAIQNRLNLLGDSRIHRLLPALRLWAAGGYRYASGYRSLLKDLMT